MLDLDVIAKEPAYVPVPSGDESPSTLLVKELFLNENEVHFNNRDFLDIWRYCIMQVLDYYISEHKYHSLEKAKSLFARPIVENISDGTHHLDAGFTALAWYLSKKDGWTPYPWMFSRLKQENIFWVVDDTDFGYQEAMLNPVSEFKDFGILVAPHDLKRV